VIRSTFLHLPGVGPVTEAELWRRGVRDWSEVAAFPDDPGLSTPRWDRVRAELQASERALAERHVEYFASRLPSAEHWRLYPSFRAETAFLDIETTGLSPYEGIVTVVSVHGGGRTRTFIADENLEELPAYLRKFRLLSTFNGRLFDVPFLEHRFPGLVVPPVHIDLRFLLYRLGYGGGLKRIEQILGVGDRSGVEGIHGLDAVRLWEAFRRGDTDSLARLVRYNRADTVNLEPLLEFAVERLSRRLLPTGPS
jgi:uncharacterized protein YprB with RNaseH-like and TPR domain